MAVEVLGSQGGHRGRSALGPVHTAAFEALADQLFYGRFDQVGADRVTFLAMGRVSISSGENLNSFATAAGD